MEVIVDRHGEPCWRRTAAAMQGAVREKVWPPGAIEEGCDQATGQRGVNAHFVCRFRL